jgi:hypothetical protein
MTSQSKLTVFIYDDDTYKSLLIFLSVCTLSVLLSINRFTRSPFVALNKKRRNVSQSYNVWPIENMNLRGELAIVTQMAVRWLAFLLLQNSKLKVTHKIFATDFHPCPFAGRGPEVMLKLIWKNRQCFFYVELRHEISPHCKRSLKRSE